MTYEPHHEKTCYMHVRKQRPRSAVQHSLCHRPGRKPEGGFSNVPAHILVYLFDKISSGFSNCRKTQSTFYNKAEVLICIQAFTYILDWNQSQDDRHHALIGSMRNLNQPFRGQTASQTTISGIEYRGRLFCYLPNLSKNNMCIQNMQNKDKCQQQFNNFNF